ncbi:MAG: ABC transporter permease [Sedimentisphaerales bacterium]|nr:ABC transporter permease [Sedimentisphaerales bacterium]
MSFVGTIGEQTINAFRRQRHVVAVAATVMAAACRMTYWSRPIRNVLARQILFTGLDAVRFVGVIALLVGLSVVLQTQVWFSRFGQSSLIGPLLVAVIIREAGPLLVNFLVIGRSGTAISSELSTMRVAGEIRLLDGMGLDPLIYLVMPRVIGVAVSVFCLTILFIVLSFASGYMGGLLLGLNVGAPSVFVDSVFSAIRLPDVLNVLAKTFIPGMLTGTICCIEGLSVRGAMTEVPQAATRGVIRSVAAMFTVLVLVSVLTYL